MVQGDNRKDCCKTNLGPEIRVNPSVVYRVCRVCTCRHFEMTVNPGMIGLRGARIG